MSRFLTVSARSLRVSFAFLALFSATIHAGTASLDALPGAAPVGSEIIVRGTGYPVLETIELRLVEPFGGPETPAGDLVVDDTGRLYGRITVPAVDRGSYDLEGWLRGVQLSGTEFDVTDGPVLSVTPTSGPPGTLAAVSFGPTPAGRVTVFYADVPVLGPIQHGGGTFDAEFIVPADRPDPLGGIVPVRAEVEAGGSLAGVAEIDFQSQPAEADTVVLTQFSGPGQPLSPGEIFQFSGQVQVPSFRSPTDYRFSAAMRASDGRLIPVDLRPIEVDAAGNFSGQGVMPSIASGFGFVEFPETTDLGLVYKLPGTGNSDFLQATVITYTPFEVQNLKFRVLHDGQPVETAVVNLFSNTLYVPPGYDYEEDGIPDIRAGDPTLQKPTWSAAYAPPNQYYDALNEITQAIGMHTNEVTGCPVTLGSGLTDAQGEWDVNAVPFLNWLLDATAQEVSDIALGFVVNGPGKATFSAKIGAVHLGYGIVNDDGYCTGQRFDFQYDYDSDLWFLRAELDGDFDQPFNPNETFDVPLPDCGAAQLGIPADPYMPGLPSKQVSLRGQPIPRFGAIWSFPQLNGAGLSVDQELQFRLPHLPAVFGELLTPTLYIDDVEMGQLTATGAPCGQDGIEYMIELPQLRSYPPGIYSGRIEATMLGGQPVVRYFQVDIRPGPTWITQQAGDYDSRTITWAPDKVFLWAVEPTRSRQVQPNNEIGYGIDRPNSNNVTAAAVSQALFPSGAGTRRRIASAEAEAVDNPATEPVDSEANGSASSPVDAVPFGSMEPITILDTGKIPLFRYVWGIPPIAAASVGADVWFKALYRYFGEVIMTNQQVLIDATAEAIAQAGLDLWIDASVILDLVSLNASALPNFELTMPIVIDDNQLDTQASQPCLDFALDVSWTVEVGWCPFCVKTGDITNLFTVLEGNGCPSSPNGKQRSVRGTLPNIPPIDRTALAVDGLGASSLVWGDGTGRLNIQRTYNGIPAPLESVDAGPGAMGPDIAYFDADRSVMVWAQNALSEADFLALDGDPGNPLDGDASTAMANQHLVYRVHDGIGWSSTMPLTMPGGGDGGVVLAACPATDPACPPGGEVLAVWVHDASGNINLHDMKLRYSFFNGTTWSFIRDVDPFSTAKDVQPAATYLNGEPVVFWVRNPSVSNDGVTATYDLNQRQLAYRFLLQAAGVQLPTTTPTGIASPSVAPFLDDALVVTFSKATDPGAFLGTRRSLWTAYAIQCFQGTCNVGNAVERTDSNGRRIFVERPRLTRNAAGDGVLTFRQVGVENPTADDPPGVLQNTGALMQLVFEFTPSAPPALADPFELSNAGGVNWRVDSVFDPSANAVLTSAIQVEQAAAFGIEEQRRPIHGVKERRIGTAGATLVTVERPMRPDFELVSASLDAAFIPEGGSAMLNVRLRNNGTPWTEPEPLTLATFWDGPAGLGLAGPSRTIDDLVSGQVTELNVTIPLPAGFSEDDTHTLRVALNPFGTLDEADAGNNADEILVGALPVPEGLVNIDGDASGNIVIHWDPVADPRVTGYRVYRRNPDGSLLHVGWSPVAGFADFSAYPEQQYEYFVTSHSARLTESAPSQAVRAWTLDPDRVFKDGFE